MFIRCKKLMGAKFGEDKLSYNHTIGTQLEDKNS